MASLEPLEDGHRDALVRFLAAFPGERRGEAFWRARLALWWEDNPAFAEGGARGWVLREDEEVVGFMGCVPGRFHLAGETIGVQAATTWRVLPEHRSQSLALLFALVSSAADTLLFFTTPNAHARRIMDRLRFAPLPRGGDTLAVLPAAGGGAEGGSLEARPLARGEADGEVDALWATLRGRFAATAERPAAVLDWYCFAGAHHRKALLGARDGAGPRGILITEPGEHGGAPAWRVRDLWCDLDDAEAVDALLEGARREARAAGCAALVVPPLDARVAARLRRMGARAEEAGEPAGRVRAPAALLAGLRAPGAYLTGLLGDTGL